MNVDIDDWLLVVVIAFCRIGACIMIMPGSSSARVSPRVRLYLALAVTMAIAPIVSGHLLPAVQGKPRVDLLTLIASETAIGLLIGLMARFFFLALHFAGMMVATFMGIMTAPGMAVEESEPSTGLADMTTLTATLLFFITDQHIEVIRAIVQSFAVLPTQDLLGPEFAIAQLSGVLNLAFILALQVAAPFIIYTIVINLLLGVTNRMIPQIPVQFVATPLVLFGGLFLFYLLASPLLQLFTQSFARWLERG